MNHGRLAAIIGWMAVFTLPLSGRAGSACAEKDLADCIRKCDAGSAVSCHRAAQATEDRAGFLTYEFRACKGGHWDACWKGIQVIESDRFNGLWMLRAGCAHDRPYACHFLAGALGAGPEGAAARQSGVALAEADQGERKALRLWEEACARRDWSACASAGRLYRRGEHVSKDGAKAATLLQKGCDSPEGSGCYDLAQLFDGDTVEAENKDPWSAVDVARAARALKRSCEFEKMSQATSCYRLARYYESAAGGLPPDSLKVQWALERACIGGYYKDYGDACLKAGLGQPDPQRAAALFKKGCQEKENEKCCKLLPAEERHQ